MNDPTVNYIEDIVGVGRNSGIQQESLMHNSAFCRLPGLFFQWSVVLRFLLRVIEVT